MSVMTEKSCAARVTTAMILRQRIAELGLKNVDVAIAIGYRKPNIVSMFKTGQTALPLSKVVAMAKVLELDPVFLFRQVVQDAHPDIAEAICNVFGETGLVSETEREVLALLRRHARGYSIDPPNDEERRKLALLVEGWARGRHNSAQARVRQEAINIGKPEMYPSIDFEAIAVL